MSDLRDRLLTCAAFLSIESDHVADVVPMSVHALKDAADLLIEASNQIADAKPPLGEPWESIPPPKQQPPDTPPTTPFAGYDADRPSQPGPFPDGRACPQCGNNGAKTVRRDGRRLMLVCGVCAREWQYKPQARWV